MELPNRNAVFDALPASSLPTTVVSKKENPAAGELGRGEVSKMKSKARSRFVSAVDYGSMTHALPRRHGLQ